MTGATGYAEALRRAENNVRLVQDKVEHAGSIRAMPLKKLDELLRNAVSSLDEVADLAPRQAKVGFQRQATDFRSGAQKLLLFCNIGRQMSASPAQYIDGLVDFCTALFTQAKKSRAAINKEIVRLSRNRADLRISPSRHRASEAINRNNEEDERRESI